MFELKDGIFYVGVKDEKLGAYNNAYLVKGEKTALIDTVSEELTEEYIKNIEEIIPLKDIDYLICNHTEPDKSGAVGRVLELNPDIAVVGTIAAVKNIKEIVNSGFNEQIAKNGAVIELGGKSLGFCILPNLNWPDSMVTYERDSKTLFSCDIFSSYSCNDTVTEKINEKIFELGLKLYFDEKLSPYCDFVRTAADKLSRLDIDCIFTGFGPVITDNVEYVIEKYTEWSSPKENKELTAAIFYASNYGYTREMAKTVYDTLKACGIRTECFDISNGDVEDVVENLNNADALVFGSPTVNRNAPKCMWDLISYIDMVNSRNKRYFVFGSYGWGGEAAMLIHKHLEEMKLRPFSKPFGAILKLSDEKKTELEKYTRNFAKSLKK